MHYPVLQCLDSLGRFLFNCFKSDLLFNPFKICVYLCNSYCELRTTFIAERENVCQSLVVACVSCGIFKANFDYI